MHERTTALDALRAGSIEYGNGAGPPEVGFGSNSSEKKKSKVKLDNESRLQEMVS